MFPSQKPNKSKLKSARQYRAMEEQQKMDRCHFWVHQLVSEPTTYATAATHVNPLGWAPSDQSQWGRSASSGVGRWKPPPNPSPRPPKEGTTGVAASPSQCREISKQRPLPETKINKIPQEPQHHHQDGDRPQVSHRANFISETNSQKPFQNPQIAHPKTPPRQPIENPNQISHLKSNCQNHSQQRNPLKTNHISSEPFCEETQRKPKVAIQKINKILTKNKTQNSKEDQRKGDENQSMGKHNPLPEIQFTNLSSENISMTKEIDELMFELDCLANEGCFDDYFFNFVNIVFPLEKFINPTNEEFIKKYLLKAFMEGLPHDTKMYVSESAPSNLLHAMNLAIQFEDEIKHGVMPADEKEEPDSVVQTSVHQSSEELMPTSDTPINLENIVNHKNHRSSHCYIQGVEIDSNDSVVWNQLGTLSCSMGLLSISRWAFEQGLLYSPNNWNCMEKLLEILLAIGDEVACLSVVDLILRHWPSHSRALHVKKTIKNAERLPFTPRGIEKLEPKHVRLTFPDKRKSHDGDESGDNAACKRHRESLELNLAGASWSAIADAILSIFLSTTRKDSEPCFIHHDASNEKSDDRQENTTHCDTYSNEGCLGRQTYEKIGRYTHVDIGICLSPTSEIARVILLEVQDNARGIYHEAVTDLLNPCGALLILLSEPEKGTIVEKRTEEDEDHLKELLVFCINQRQPEEVTVPRQRNSRPPRKPPDITTFIKGFETLTALARPPSRPHNIPYALKEFETPPLARPPPKPLYKTTNTTLQIEKKTQGNFFKQVVRVVKSKPQFRRSRNLWQGPTSIPIKKTTHVCIRLTSKSKRLPKRLKTTAKSIPRRWPRRHKEEIYRTTKSQAKAMRKRSNFRVARLIFSLERTRDEFDLKGGRFDGHTPATTVVSSSEMMAATFFMHERGTSPPLPSLLDKENLAVVEDGSVTKLKVSTCFNKEGSRYLSAEEGRGYRRTGCERSPQSPIPLFHLTGANGAKD